MSTEREMMERRLAALEAAVAEIQSKLGITATAPHWVEKVAGIVRDEEAFEEMMAFVRAQREADGVPGDMEEPAA